MSADWTAGRYLRTRREAASKTLVDVAAEFHTAPRLDERARIELLTLVEADEAEANVTIAAAYRGAGVRFDARVLVMLVPPQGVPLPMLCARCGCSQADPCDDAGRGCSWAAPELCSCCGPAPDADAIMAAAA